METLETLLQALLIELKELKAVIIAQHTDLCHDIGLLCEVFYDFEDEEADEEEESEEEVIAAAV